MASRKKEDLHPILKEAFEKAEIEYLKAYPDSPKPFLTCTYRSNLEQDQLFSQVTKVTNAKAGQSPHNYLPSLAFDIAFLKPDKSLDWSNINFKRFADIIVLNNGKIEWGGAWVRFVDLPHFQLFDWKSYK
jgi:peptidoglycan L-alanyl-D-glutamate endopeptidase CwlK